jgi:NAD(P)H-nitrite reductase large subunit
MDLDAKVCYCFHITRRKLVNFARIERPRVASQMSACGSAGTGCGWCVPFLKQIFEQVVHNAAVEEMDTLAIEEYAQRRGEYLRAGGGVAPPGAEPPPEPKA